MTRLKAVLKACSDWYSSDTAMLARLSRLWISFSAAIIVAGAEIPVRGDMLRSSGLELMGSGIGSVSIKNLVAGAGELLAAAPAAGFRAPVMSLPLEALTEAWNGDPDVRYILTP